MIDWLQYLAHGYPAGRRHPARDLRAIVDLLAVGTHYDVAALARLASGVHRWHEQHA